MSLRDIDETSCVKHMDSQDPTEASVEISRMNLRVGAVGADARNQAGDVFGVKVSLLSGLARPRTERRKTPRKFGLRHDGLPVGD